MQRTVLDKSLKEFSFEIHYLDNPIEIENIGNANYDDIIFVRCYPKWNMREEELMEYMKAQKLFLLKNMEAVSDEHESFYCYFDINYTTIKGTTSKIVDHKVIWVEARPEIRKKDIDSNPSGFINAEELPPEK